MCFVHERRTNERKLSTVHAGLGLGRLRKVVRVTLEQLIWSCLPVIWVLSCFNNQDTQAGAPSGTGHGLQLSRPCTLQQPFCRECCQPQRTLAAVAQITSGLHTS